MLYVALMTRSSRRQDPARTLATLEQSSPSAPLSRDRVEPVSLFIFSYMHGPLLTSTQRWPHPMANAQPWFSIVEHRHERPEKLYSSTGFHSRRPQCSICLRSSPVSSLPVRRLLMFLCPVPGTRVDGHRSAPRQDARNLLPRSGHGS